MEAQRSWNFKDIQMYASSLQHVYDTCYLAYEYYVMVTVM